MRQRFGIYTVIAIATLAIACSRHREGVVKADGQTAIVVTEDELAKYVVWWRDYLELVNRHIAEMETVRQRVSSRYSFAETGRISQDPELLATLDRQRSTMQELDNRKPVDGLKMRALRDTVPGVATLGVSARQGRVSARAQRNRTRCGAPEVRRPVRGLDCGARKYDRADSFSVNDLPVGKPVPNWTPRRASAAHAHDGSPARESAPLHRF